MDGTRFDQLVREMLGGASRRGLLRSMSALPVFGGLASLVVADDDVAEAKKKKNKSKKCKKKKKKACDGGKCGTVTVKCSGKKKKVNCGACGCDPACPVCQICDDESLTCVPDPEQIGDSCGAGGETCQADGTCVACDVCDGCTVESIQDAIDAASSGDTIIVCPGTFNEDLFIDKDITIIGAGQGADPINNTIVDGTGTTRTVRVEGDILAELQFMRITGGVNAFGAGVDSDGDVTLTNVTVIGNVASDSGGGLFNNPGRNMTLINCTVTDNDVDGAGGGILNQGTLVLTNTDVTDNDVQGSGGGIFNIGTATLDADSSVTGNFATSDGGGVFNEGTITCAAATVTGNTADDPPVTSDCINGGGGTGCASCAS